VVFTQKVEVEELLSWSLVHAVRLFAEVHENFLGDSLREVHEFVTQIASYSQRKPSVLSLLSKRDATAFIFERDVRINCFLHVGLGLDQVLFTAAEYLFAEAGTTALSFIFLLLKFELEYRAADLDISFLIRLDLHRLLDHFERAELRLEVLENEFLDETGVEYLCVALTDALIVDNKVTFLASAQNNNPVPRHPDYLDIFTFRHPQHF
jgi:hypothetical protein